jgi:hypothetical protein
MQYTRKNSLNNSIMSENKQMFGKMSGKKHGLESENLAEKKTFLPVLR